MEVLKVAVEQDQFGPLKSILQTDLKQLNEYSIKTSTSSSVTLTIILNFFIQLTILHKNNTVVCNSSGYSNLNFFLTHPSTIM